MMQYPKAGASGERLAPSEGHQGPLDRNAPSVTAGIRQGTLYLRPALSVLMVATKPSIPMMIDTIANSIIIGVPM